MLHARPERSFLCRVSRLTLRKRVKSSYMLEVLGVEQLLLQVTKSQLGWFRHLVRIPPGWLPEDFFLGISNWKGTLGKT